MSMKQSVTSKLVGFNRYSGHDTEKSIHSLSMGDKVIIQSYGRGRECVWLIGEVLKVNKITVRVQTLDSEVIETYGAHGRVHGDSCKYIYRFDQELLDAIIDEQKADREIAAQIHEARRNIQDQMDKIRNSITYANDLPELIKVLDILTDCQVKCESELENN